MNTFAFFVGCCRQVAHLYTLAMPGFMYVSLHPSPPCAMLTYPSYDPSWLRVKGRKQAENVSREVLLQKEHPLNSCKV